MVCHKEGVIAEVNTILFTGLLLVCWVFLFQDIYRDHGTTFMKERLHSTCIANSKVIWSDYLFLGRGELLLK